jgi:putative protein-disulfide isomerase
MTITYITDPLCCWSWGMQPHIDSLQARFNDQIIIQYVMGGLLPSWEQYHDVANAVSRPAQMGPVWMHAAQLTGRPVNYQLWIKDPPSSSYPACIAVKCAQLQEAAAGISLFKKLQQAAMADAKNIASWPVIQEIASIVKEEYPLFDEERFATDFLSESGANAFRADLDKVAKHSITRFPSLLIEVKGQRSILITGYRTHDSLLSAIGEAFPAGLL